MVFVFLSYSDFEIKSYAFVLTNPATTLLAWAWCIASPKAHAHKKVTSNHLKLICFAVEHKYLTTYIVPSFRKLVGAIPNFKMPCFLSATLKLFPTLSALPPKRWVAKYYHIAIE